MRPTILYLAISMLAGSCFAQEPATHLTPGGEPHQAAAHQAVPDPEPHPDLSTNASWVRGLTTFIITLFLLAAAVGSLARLSLPEEPPRADDTHGHDEHDAHRSHDTHAPASGHH